MVSDLLPGDACLQGSASASTSFEADRRTGASPAASPAKVETTDDVIANEKLVWELFRTRNFDAFQTLLAPEFMEIEPTGVYDRAGTVKGVSEMDASQFEQS